MNEKKYLVYLDILGFKDLAKEIAGKFEKGPIREKFLSEPLKEKIEELEKEGVKWTKGISAITGSDDYVLLIDDDIDKMLKVISEISSIKIPHEEYNFIPLEIAVDIKDIEMAVKIKNSINRDEVIEFLKNDIINPYKKLYKEKHGEQSIIKETFIVLTNSAFAELKVHQKKECTKYNYREKEFYYVPLNVIERERKISDFLKEIGQSRGDYTGALIDKIFIPPDELEEIRDRLKNDRIVFITGAPGYGKTYTAIRLLWEWYNEGYVPRWVAGKEPEDRKAVRGRLANIEPELKPKHVIYFEDPFGKTIYERRDDLKERINSIINSVRNKEDAYVIITSRKDVFEEFERESYSVEEIKAFEKELNILNPSYGYEKRKEILEKWAGEKGCEWLEDEKPKKIVFELLVNEECLPTPLSIHDFAEATVKIKDERELRQKIDKYSEAVEKAFADEIKGLYDSGRKDRGLFLSIIFVSEHFRVDFVKQVYGKLKKEGFEDFERILKEEYRVNVGKEWTEPFESWEWDYGQEEEYRVKLEFSHPSYSNALSYILDHAGCKNVFCEVLRELAHYDEVAWAVASAVAGNFDELPEDVRNKLLFKLSEKDGAAGGVARAVAGNFDKLPKAVRNLLFKLSEKDEAAWGVAEVVAGNFDELPEDVRNKLLLKLSEKDGAAEVVVRTVAGNFDKLPEGVRNELLLKLSEKDEAAGYVARAVAENFDKLPKAVRNLLFKLSEKDEAAWGVAEVVAGNFDKLPEGVRNKLLLKLSEKDKAVWVVAMAVAGNFDRLPEGVRNELLLKLSEKDEATITVAWAVAGNFDKLPEDVRNKLLLKLSEKPEAARAVARAVAKNFDKLPEDVRNLLFKLSEKDGAAGDVARAVAGNFDKPPEDVRNKILLKLSEKGYKL